MIKSDPCRPTRQPHLALTYQGIDIAPLGSSCGFWHQGTGGRSFEFCRLPGGTSMDQTSYRCSTVSRAGQYGSQVKALSSLSHLSVPFLGSFSVWQGTLSCWGSHCHVHVSPFYYHFMYLYRLQCRYLGAAWRGSVPRGRGIISIYLKSLFWSVGVFSYSCITTSVIQSTYFCTASTSVQISSVWKTRLKLLGSEFYGDGCINDLLIKNISHTILNIAESPLNQREM